MREISSTEKDHISLDKTEILRRRRAFLKIVKGLREKEGKGETALLLTSDHLVSYVSGYLRSIHSPPCYALLVKDECYLLSAASQSVYPWRRSFGRLLISEDYAPPPLWAKAITTNLIDWLKANGIDENQFAEIAYEWGGLTRAQQKEIRAEKTLSKHFPAQLDCEDQLNDLLSIKSEFDLAMLRFLSGMARVTARQVLSRLTEGVSEAELATMAEAKLHDEMHYELFLFEHQDQICQVSAGINGEGQWVPPTDQTIDDGLPVTMRVFVAHAGFRAGLQRLTYCNAPATPLAEQNWLSYIELMQHSKQMLSLACEEGETLGFVADKIHEFAKNKDLKLAPDYPVGMDSGFLRRDGGRNHKLDIVTGNPTKLAKGMVFSLSPILWADAGLGLENYSFQELDQLVVTSDGIENITVFQRGPILLAEQGKGEPQV